MKHQALFSSKDKSKNIKVSSAATLLPMLCGILLLLVFFVHIVLFCESIL